MGGLAAGLVLGIPTGGWAPHDWRTEKGPAPFLAQLGLKEHESRAYPPRTEVNILTSDGTVLFFLDPSPGTSLTSRLATRYNRPLFRIPLRPLQQDPKDYRLRFLIWLSDYKVEVLNVAGNRESVAPGITHQVQDFLVEALSRGYC